MRRNRSRAWELQRGIQVEREHTSDPRLAQRIAEDHLRERPDYYSMLDLVENVPLSKLKKCVRSNPRPRRNPRGWCPKCGYMMFSPGKIRVEGIDYDPEHFGWKAPVDPNVCPSCGLNFKEFEMGKDRYAALMKFREGLKPKPKREVNPDFVSTIPDDVFRFFVQAPADQQYAVEVSADDELGINTFPYQTLAANNETALKLIKRIYALSDQTEEYVFTGEGNLRSASHTKGSFYPDGCIWYIDSFIDEHDDVSQVIVQTYVFTTISLVSRFEAEKLVGEQEADSFMFAFPGYSYEDPSNKFVLFFSLKHAYSGMFFKAGLMEVIYRFEPL